MILLMILGLGILFAHQKDIDLESLKNSLKNFNVEQKGEEIKSEILRHIRDKHIKDKKDKDGGLHETPPGCKDTEGRVLTPLRAECR
jgi:hypothetical protein